MTIVATKTVHKCDAKLLGGPVDCQQHIELGYKETLPQFMWLITGWHCLCPAHRYLIEGANKV